jgi:hypothetical protein
MTGILFIFVKKNIETPESNLSVVMSSNVESKKRETYISNFQFKRTMPAQILVVCFITTSVNYLIE